MSRYSTVPVFGVQTLHVQASSISELERNLAVAQAQLVVLGGVVVTAIRAAGAGDGHSFTVSIEYGVGQGYDPANMELLCYFADLPGEIDNQYNAAVARATAGTEQVDAVSMGASGGRANGGVLVYVPAYAVEPQNLWHVQTEWYISRQHGSDSNDGSLATPLRTHAEFTRRMGWNPTLYVSYMVHIIDMFDVTQVPIAEGLVWEATFSGPYAAVVYQGVRIPTAVTGQVGTFVAMSPTGGAPGTAGYFTDNAAGTFAAAVGRLVCFDPSGINPSYSFITASTNANARARTTTPSFRGPQRKFTNVTPVNGMDYEVQLIPRVNDVNLIAHRVSMGEPPTVGYEQECFTLEFLSVVEGNMGATETKLMWDGGSPTWQTWFTPSPVMFACMITGAVVDSQILMVECMFGVDGTPGRATIRDSQVFILCNSGGTISTYNSRIMAIDFNNGQSYFDSGGVYFGYGTTFATTDARSFGVYNPNNEPAIWVDFGAEMELGSVWGVNTDAGAAAFALRVDGHAWYTIGAVLEIAKGAGAATDCQIGGTGVNYSGGGNILPWANVVTNGVGGNTAMFIERPAP
jgi:hypothetical protein